MSNNTLLDQIKNIIARSKDWATLELEYAKLTAAEKITVLAGAACTGIVCLMLFMSALILFGFALAYLFQRFMCPSLSFLAAGGCMLVITAVVYLVREQIIINPIARIITKILLK
ncbi:MAG: phage holin family protein [Bacteroides sp.]|nr:phage holin family protein [Bacteroides sp.]